MIGRAAALGLSCVVVVAMLSGCVTIDAPSSYRQTWQPPKKADRLISKTDGTWQHIRAQTVDAQHPLELLELIDTSLLNNPKTNKAWENARSLWAKKIQSQADYYPAITGSMEVLRSKKDANVRSNGWNYTDYKPTATLTYLLYDMGGREARVAGATYDLLAANFKFNRAIQDLVLDVGKAYYALYAAQAQIVASKFDVDNAKTSLVSAQKKFSAGLVSRLDVLQAESNYYNSVYGLENAKGNQKTAKADLALVLGLSADTPFTIVTPHKKLPTGFDKEDVSHLIEEALEARPDIIAERSVLKSKEAAVRVAEAGLMPKFTFGTSITKNTYENYNTAKEGDDDYLYNAFDFTGTWNVFDGFSNYAKVWQARADANAERENLQQTELQLAHDVWAKFFTYRANIKKSKASKAYFTSSKGSYDLALEGYRAGLKSILDLTKAQSDLSDARSKVITSEKELFFSLLELVSAIGALYPETVRPYLE